MRNKGLLLAYSLFASALLLVVVVGYMFRNAILGPAF